MKSDTSNAPQPEVKFFDPEVIERPWGSESVVAYIPGVCIGKILRMVAGAKGGLQKHRLKDESAYIVSGELIFRRVVDGELTEEQLGPGDCVFIPKGAVHQEEAVTDCVIYEVGTPHLNDRQRVEREFGLSEEEGLPTTTLEEIEIR